MVVMDILEFKAAYEWFLLRACFAALSALILTVVCFKVYEHIGRPKAAAKRYGWPFVILFIACSAWATYTAFPASEEKNRNVANVPMLPITNTNCQLGDGAEIKNWELGNGTGNIDNTGNIQQSHTITLATLTQDDFERGFVLTRIGTNEVHDFNAPEGAIINPDWLAFGASRDWDYPSADDWSFLLGTNRIERLRVFSYGEVMPIPSFTNTYFAPFKTLLGIVPEANWHLIDETNRPSQFWYHITSLNSLKLTWQNVLYGRETNATASFQMELWPDGNFTYRYDLSRAGLWNGEAVTNILIGAANEGLLESVDVSALTNLTSLTFYRLNPADSPGSDQDGDGLTVEDELFVYHTDPNSKDFDYDGFSDGDEVAAGSNPAARDSDGDGLVDGADPDPMTETSLADADQDGIPDAYEDHWFGSIAETHSATNRDETGFTLQEKMLAGINPTNGASALQMTPSGNIASWQLFNAFAADRPANAPEIVWERTFTIGRTSAWQQFFLSAAPTNAASWNLLGMELEWETDEGASGVLKASPLGDSFRIPLSTNEVPYALALRLRATGAHTVYSPTPIHLIAYIPEFRVEGGKEITGKSGQRFQVFTDGSDSVIRLGIDHSKRPCKAPVGEDECDMSMFEQMSEYNPDFGFAGDMTGGTINVSRPGALDFPDFSLGVQTSTTFRRTRRGMGGGAIVVLDPSASWKCNGHGCGYDGLGYDWGGYYYEEESYPLDSKCLRKSWYRDYGGGYHEGDCEVAVTAGTDSGYVTTDVKNDTGYVYVDGIEVWSDSPEHTYDDTGCGGGYSEDYLGDGCDSCDTDCSNGNCDSMEGPDLGSLKFRIPFGNPVKGQFAGFVWFSTDEPLWISKSIFNVLSHPSATVSDTTSYGVRRIVSSDRRGRDLRIQDISDGVTITIYENDTGKLEHTWEITNVNGDDAKVRLRKISRLGNVMSDETFTYQDGDWTRFDNIAGIGTQLYIEDDFYDYGDGIKRETFETTDANGNILKRVTTEKTRIGECDNAVMREVYREETTGRNTVYTYADYWNDPSHSGRHGQPRLVWGNARAWVYTDFDEKGHETLRVEQRGNADIPGDFPYIDSNVLYNASSLENAFVTVKDYSPFDGDDCHADDAAKARQETRYVVVNGTATVIGRTWTRYTRLMRNGYEAIKKETWRETGEDSFLTGLTRLTGLSGLGNANLVNPVNPVKNKLCAYSYEIIYADTGFGTPLLMRGAVAESLDENGILTVNSCSLDGNVLTCETRKFTQPSTFNSSPISHLSYLITEQDATYGNVLLRQERLTANDTVISAEQSTYDEKNRLRSTTYLDGTFITNTYSCCRLLWRQDREGRKTLRSAKTGTDHLYNAEEDVWLADISTNGQYRVTQHFFDALGHETNTVVCMGTVPGEAEDPDFNAESQSRRETQRGGENTSTNLCTPPHLCSSALKIKYPYGGSDYSICTDERGKETVSQTDILGDAIESSETIFTNGVEVLKTKNRTYLGGGSSMRREWLGGSPSSATAWAEERRFTDYAADGKRIDYVVTESSDCGIVTNSVSAYDLLGRLVASAVSGVNGSVITTICTYDGTTGRKLTERTTGSPAISYEYDSYGNLSATIQDGKSIRNTTTYETIDGEVYRVTTRIRMTGNVTNSVQYRKQQLTGLSNELRSKIISLASSGRVSVSEKSFSAETGSLTETSQSEDETPMTIVSRYGLPHEQVTIDGRSVISYDALGREAEARFYDIGDETPNRIEVKEYDISGNVIRILTDLMDGRSGETLSQYDTLNREVRREDILGHAIETSYDPLGRTISVGGDTYPLRSGYDTQGRKISGSTTRDNGLTWDETNWEFDAASGVNTAKVYADGTRIVYNYTDNGRKTRTTWARGVWKQNAYNERNLVSGTTYSDSTTPSVAYTYSNAGKMASASLSDGTAYSYDYDNRLLNTAENIAIAGEGYSLPRTYDDYCRNVKTSVIHTNVHYAAKTRIYDSENRVCGYVLTNAAGRGVTVNVSYIGSYQNGIAYTFPNGNTFTVDFEREASRKHLVTNRHYWYGNQQVYSYATQYDLLERPMNAMDSLSAAREWLYNNRNELASAVIGTNSYAYVYDSIGNREWAAENASTNTYSANALNQYAQVDSQAIAYDADGNLTQDDRYDYTYDAENRLVTVVPIAPTEGSLSIYNRYDHKGLRIRKIVKRYANGWWNNHATHTFIFDGGNIVLERIAKADGNHITKEYFWGIDKSGSEQGAGGVGGLLAVSVNGVFSIPCYDHNGNIVAYVSENGGIESLYVYDAYGNTIEKSGEKADVHSFGFSTKYHDREVGLIGYQKRFYCPDHGRWLNRDPIEEEGGENLYAFCGNNPINKYDLLGQSTCCREGKKISCSNTYSWDGSVTTMSVSRFFVGVTFLMIDLTSNYVCGSCTRYKLHAKVVLPTLSVGAPISITGASLRFGDVKPDAFAGAVLFSSVGIGAMGTIEASLLRLGSATAASLGVVGGAEFGMGISYGWYVDYDMKEE